MSGAEPEGVGASIAQACANGRPSDAINAARLAVLEGMTVAAPEWDLAVDALANSFADIGLEAMAVALRWWHSGDQPGPDEVDYLLRTSTEAAVMEVAALVLASRVDLGKADPQTARGATVALRAIGSIDWAKEVADSARSMPWPGWPCDRVLLDLLAGSIPSIGGVSLPDGCLDVAAAVERYNNLVMQTDQLGLRELQFVISGSVLLLESDYGREEMAGRFAYVEDDPLLVREALGAVLYTLEGWAFQPRLVMWLEPGRGLDLAAALANVLAADLGEWTPGDTREALVVTYDLSQLRWDDRGLRERPARQPLWCHVVDWTTEYAVAPEIVSFLAQTVSTTWTMRDVVDSPLQASVTPARQLPPIGLDPGTRSRMYAGVTPSSNRFL